MRTFVLIACLLHAATAAPQFVTFKDGKIGVNFGGYSADAGLGGLLTGNAAHGGLSASAGTPWGPRAAAGLGGNVDGQTSGVAYAGAEANPSVGASSVLGGSAGSAGYAGSEAHASGKAVSKTIAYAPAVVPVATHTTTIQKIKPPKKYTLIKTDHHNAATTATEIALPVAAKTTVEHRQIVTTRDATNTNGGDVGDDNYATTIVTRQRQRTRIHPHQRKRLTRQRQRVQIAYKQVAETEVKQAPTAVGHHEAIHSSVKIPVTPVVHTKSFVKTVALPPPPPPPASFEAHTQVHKGAVVNSALNIPIGILRSLQDSLGGLSVDKSIYVSKSG